jgi:hypothetical protein
MIRPRCQCYATFLLRLLRREKFYIVDTSLADFIDGVDILVKVSDENRLRLVEGQDDGLGDGVVVGPGASVIKPFTSIIYEFL